MLPSMSIDSSIFSTIFKVLSSSKCNMNILKYVNKNNTKTFIDRPTIKFINISDFSRRFFIFKTSLLQKIDNRVLELSIFRTKIGEARNARSLHFFVFNSRIFRPRAGKICREGGQALERRLNASEISARLFKPGLIGDEQTR